MNKGLKILGTTLISVVVIFYIVFLLVIPLAINPVNYKDDIQKAVYDVSGLNFDFEKARIITTPMLAVGLKGENIAVKMPDNKDLFKAKDFTARLSLPSLIFKTVKITYAKADSPQINLDINKQGTQYEFVDLLNEKILATTNEKTKEVSDEQNAQLENLTIKINKFLLNDYKIAINDRKNNHNLALCGDNFEASFNGKHLTVKSDAKVKYDENTNITINADIKTYIPTIEVNEQKQEETTQEIPFINPVEMFGKFDPKANADIKLSIDEGKKLPKIHGHIYITDTTLTLDKVKMPTSYIKADFGGFNVNIDSNLCLTESEKATILGSVNYGNKFNTDMAIKTDKIYLNSILKLSSALLNSLNIKTDLAGISAQGYFQTDLKINTDLKKLQSSGKFILVDASLRDSASGLSLQNIKSNLILDNNTLKIENTEASINGTPFKAEGTIDENSNADVKIYTQNLPLSPLYSTFAPSDIKKAYAIKGGMLNLDVILKGKLTELAPKINTQIKNLFVYDNVNKMSIKNSLCNIDLSTDLKTYKGTISNNNLNISAPLMQINVSNPSVKVNFDDKNITINPSDININGMSKISLKGSVKNYTKKPDIDIFASGSVKASDLKKLAGKDMEPYIKASGNIPLKLLITGNDKKQDIQIRLIGSANNFITPIDFSKAKGKQSAIQVVAELSGDKVTLKDTGLFADANSDIRKPIGGTQLVNVTGGVILDKNTTLNNIKISSNGTQNVSICAFDKSSLNADMNITVSGTAAAPILKGSVTGSDVNIPQLLTKLSKAGIDLNGKTFNFNLSELNLNGTSLNLNGTGLLDYKPIITLTDLKVASDYLNADKAMKVSEEMAKVPALQPTSSAPADMPVKITSGSINIKKLSSGAIVAENITSGLTMSKNTVYLKKLKADAFEGSINGDVSMNLITSAMKVNVSGSGMNADKTITACAGMKNTVLGTLAFNSDLTLKGATYEEQMRTLNGKADFNVTKGQFLSFGKFENFLMADNIAAISFLATKTGALMNQVAPHNTSSFEQLSGNVTFKNGLMTISPITSSGKNMSMYITGTLNLVNNYGNMLVLGSISQEISSLLGPLNQLNPVNLLRNSNTTWAAITLGVLNSINQSATPAEMNKIPALTPAQEASTISKFIVKINGNIEKPQSAVKSFRWLSSESQLNEVKTAISPVQTITETIKSIPKTKEETVKTIKEAGKNALFNIGKKLLEPNETKEEE